MKGRPILLALFVFLAASFAQYGQNWSFYTVEAGDVFVDTAGICAGNNPCFTTIQAAIDSAATIPGTAILVYNGTYSEQVNVTKSITLKTESFKSIVNGSVTLLAQNITLAGFNFTGTAASGVNANIRAYSSGNNISGNFINNSASSYKIYLNGSGNTIANNVLSQGAGDAVFLNSSSGNVISNNSLTGTSNSGIRLYNLSTNNVIDSNTMRNNSGNGIVLYPGGADYNNITNNNLSGNTNMGLRIDNATGNRAENNTMSGMLSGATWGYGILLNNGTNTTLINNTASGNPAFGIVLNSSTGTVMRNNNMSKNPYDFAIWVPSSAQSFWQHDIDSSNRLSGGKVIYVWTNLYNGPNGCTNAQVPADAGYLVLLNCRNITVSGAAMYNVSEAITLFNSSNCSITDTNVSSVKYSGVRLLNGSAGNTLARIRVANISVVDAGDNSNGAGVALSFSNSNALSGIYASNLTKGVYSEYSNWTSLSDSYFDLQLTSGYSIRFYYSNSSSINNISSTFPTTSGEGAYLTSSYLANVTNSTFNGGYDSVVLNGGGNILLHNLTMQNNNHDGVYAIASSAGNVINSSTIRNASLSSIYLQSSGDNQVISNNNISGGAYSIALSSGANVTVAANTFSAATSAAVSIDFGGGAGKSGYTIANNTIYPTPFAIKVSFSYGSFTNSLIEGNTILGAGTNAIAFPGTASGPSSNITIRNNNISNVSQYAIYLPGVSNSFVYNNVINGSLTGIYMDGAANTASDAIYNNSVFNSPRAFWIPYSSVRQGYNHTIQNNTREGLPAIYLFNISNANYSDANLSDVYLAYSSNISLKNVSLFVFAAIGTENSTVDRAVIANTPSTGTTYPVMLFNGSKNITFANAKIMPDGVYDIYTNANSATFNFINASFRKDNVSIVSGATAQLNVSWYLDFNVTGDAGPVSGANVSVYYANGTPVSSYLTDAQGRARANLSEYVQSAAGKAYYSPYIVNATSACRFAESASSWLEQNGQLDFALHGEKISIDFPNGYPKRLIDYKTNPAEIRIYNSTPAGCPGSIASVSANITGLTNASYYRTLSCPNQGAYYSCTWNESNKAPGGYSVNFAGMDGSSNTVFSDYEHVQITQWSMDNWDYRREMAINNSDVSTNLTGAAKFQLDTASLIANGSLRADCSDLRFRGFAVYELPFVVQNAGGYAENATIMVRITDRDALASFPKYGNGVRIFDSRQSNPYSSAGLQYYVAYITSAEAGIWVRYNLPAGNTTLYLYYGNDSMPSLGNAAMGPAYPTSALRALYRFDQSSGPAVYDDTGLYNGIAQNSPIFDAADKMAGIASISLSSASSQYVSIGNDLGSSTSVTFAAWVKPASGGAMTIASSGPNTGNPRLLVLRDGSNRLCVYRGGYTCSTGTTIPTGSWTHVAVTNDGSITKMYINGALDSSQSQAISQSTQTQFYLGYGAYSYFNGKMDEAVVYDRVLNSSEIQGLYNLSSTAVVVNATLPSQKPSPLYTSADYDVYHHLENCNSTNSTVWLKVPPIRAGKGDSIYMYYGNSRLAQYNIYELPVTINTSGSVPSEALVYITLNSTLGSRITADGRDVRVFTTRQADPYGSAPDVQFNLSYALGSSSSRQLIVKMPLSNSSPTKTIYVYYGNPTAASALTGFADQFANSSRWSAYDAGNSGGLNGTSGYVFGTFDGRYIYFGPVLNGTATNYTYHGRALRYDTQGVFNSSSSWSAYDAGNTSGMSTKGYYDAYFDGRYVYYSPYYNGSVYHGIALRYDTQGVFNSSSSWSAYDAGNTSNMSTKGYIGLTSNGRYIYYAPYYNGSYHGRALRYDTQGVFNSSSSWTAYDAGNSGGLTNTKGYLGTVFDGRYVYYVPYYDSTASSGKVLRYDTQGVFNSSSSWTAYDAGNSGGLTNTKGYYGAIFDGRYIYFAPFNDGTSYHAKALRYDTQGAFNSSSSWSAYDASSAGGLASTKGYIGATFDGRYVYYAPYYNGSIYHGKVLRYDTWGSFTSPSSWSAYNANNTSNLNTVGYEGAIFDGTNVYFAPVSDGTVYHGRVLKYSPLFSLNRSVSFGSEAVIGSVGDPSVNVQPTEYLYTYADFRYPLESRFSLVYKNGSISLSNNSLTISCAQGANCNFDATTKAAPYVLYPVPDGDWVATVRLENYTVNDFTQAGIMLFDDESNNVRLARHRCSSGCTYNINGYIVDEMVSNTLSSVASASNSTLPMYLQIVKFGKTKYFSYSYDGVNWVRLYTTSNLNGLYIGMFVRNWVTPYNATQAPFSGLTITRLSKTYLLPAVGLDDNRSFNLSNARAFQIPSGLAAYWSFDEGGGNYAFDYSGNSNTGTLASSPAWTQGRIGSALRFNGINSYVVVPNSASLTPPTITVAAWVKSNTSTWNSYGMLVSKRDTFIVHPEQGSAAVTFYAYVGGYYSASFTPAFSITDWHYYAGTFDGSTVAIYADGVLMASTPRTGSLYNTGELRIGGDTAGYTSRIFNGTIDEVSIWNRALSSSELLAVSNRSLMNSNVYRSTFSDPAFAQGAEEVHAALQWSPVSGMQAMPGDSVSISPILNNIGPVQMDNITLSYVCPSGWACSFNQTSIVSIPGRNSTALQFNFTIPGGETASQQPVYLVAENANGTAQTSFTVYLNQPALYWLPAANMSVYASQTYSANLTLNNSGAGTAQGVNWAYRCPANWACAFNSTGPASIPPNGALAIQLNFTAWANETSLSRNITVNYTDIASNFGAMAFSVFIAQPNLTWSANNATASLENATTLVEYLNNTGTANSTGINVSVSCPTNWTCSLNETSLFDLANGTARPILANFTIPYSCGTYANTTAVYDFEQNTYDNGGGNYPGTIVGSGATYNSTDKMEGSASLSLSNSYVNISSDLGAPADFSFTAWVKPSASGQGTFASSGPGTGVPRVFIMRDSSNRLGAYRNGYAYSNGIIPTGAWTHIAVVHQGTTTRLYLNGSLDSTQTQNAPHGAQSMFYLGYGYYGYFNGAMDDVRIFGRALNSSEVAEIYSSRINLSAIDSLGRNASTAVTIYNISKPVPALSSPAAQSATKGVVFSVNFTVTNSGTYQAKNLTIFGSNYSGWAYAFNVTNISALAPGDSVNISANITIPVSETSSNRTVYITAVDVAGRSGQASFPVNISQPALHWSGVQGSTVDPGSQTALSIMVNNSGSGTSYNVNWTVKNCPSGWSCAFNESGPINMSASSLRYLVLNITVPYNETAVSSTVNITVNDSQGNGDSASSQVLVRQPYLKLLVVNMSVAAGDNASQIVIINNTGNLTASGVNVTFGPETCSPYGFWTCSLNASSQLYSIPPNQTIQFNLTFTVDINEAQPSRNITINAKDDANRQFSAKIRVNVTQPALVWYSVAAQSSVPESNLSVNLTLLNNGTANATNVALTASAITGWAQSFNISLLPQLAALQNATLVYNASIPYNETAASRGVTLTATDYLGHSGQTSFTVNINQPAISLAPVLNYTLNPGDSIIVNLTANNTGTSMLKYANFTVNCPSSVVCTFNETSQFTLANGSAYYRSVTLDINASETAASKTVAINASDSAGRSSARTFYIYINQPNLSIGSPAAITADVDNTTRMDFNISNNGASTAYNIAVNSTCPPGWACVLNTTLISSLNAGATVPVSVNFTIPYSEASASKQINITVNDSLGRFRSSSTTVNLNQPVVALAAISNYTLNPGDSIAVNMTVANSGASTLKNANFSVSCPANVACAFNETALFNLAAGSPYNRTIVLNISPSETESSKAVAINASDSAGRANSRTFYLYINQPNLSIGSPAAITADVDNTTRMDFNISNNGASTAYNIAVNSTCPANWTCALNTTLISSLAPAGSAQDYLNLTVPYSERAAARQVNVSINDSLGRYSRSSTAVNLNQPNITLAAINNSTLNAGDSLAVNATITNTGAATLKYANFTVNCPSNVVCTFNETSQFTLANGSAYARSIILNISPSETESSRTVAINASDSAGRTHSRTFYIYINQPNLSIGSPAAITADVDNTTRMDFNVSNNGVSTAYGIAVNSTCPANWTCALNTTLISSLAAGATVPASVNFTIPYSERSASRSVNISANDSLGRFSRAAASVNLNQPALNLSSIQNQTSSPGGSLQADFTINNSGAHDAKNINVTLNCPSGWACAFNQSAFASLAAGQSQSISAALNVSISEGAASRGITINASDEAGRSATSSFTVTLIQPELNWLDPGTPTIDPGTSSGYALVLNNSGAPTSYVQSINITSCPAGWSCTINNTGPVNISGSSSLPVALNISVPYSEANSTRRVNITATDIASKKINLSIALNINQPLIAYSVQNLTTNPGVTINGLFSISNAGSAIEKGMNLTNACPAGWTCSLNDTAIVNISAGETRYYQLSLAIPANDISSSRIINLTARDEGGRVFRANFTVFINQPSLNWSQIANLSAAPESSITANATLSNNGAFNSTYVSLAIGCPAGWNCTIEPSFISVLAVGESANITINLSIPYSERQAVRTLALNATDGYGRASSTTFNILLAQPSFAFGETANRSQTPGESFIIPFNLSNNGTYIAKAVSVNTTCPTNWRCNFTLAYFANISAGENVSLALNVSVPLTESAASRILNLTARDDAGRNASRTVNITLNQPSLHWNDPGTLPADPGPASNYVLILNNSGGSTAYIQVMVVQSCPPAWACSLNESGPVNIAPYSYKEVELAVQPPYSEVSASATVAVSATDISAQTKTLSILFALSQPNIIFTAENLTTDTGATVSGLFNVNNTGTLAARDVNVSGSCPPGWACQLNDTGASDIGINATRYYNLTVSVPGGETAFFKTINLTARDSGTRAFRSNFTVFVNQPMLNWSAPPVVQADLDILSTMGVILTNAGAANSSGIIVSANCPYNWVCNFTPSNITVLPPSQFADVNFTYRVPYNDKSSESNITLSATDSLGRSGARGITFQISQPVLRFDNVSTLALNRGQTVVVNLTLSNNGSADARNVNLTIACPQSPNWLCTLNSTAQFNLSAGGARVFSLTVGVPETEASASRQVNVTAADSVGRNTTLSILFAVSQPVLYFDAVPANSTAPGAPAVFDVTLHNGGSATAWNVSANNTCPQWWNCTLTTPAPTFNISAGGLTLVSFALTPQLNDTAGGRNVTLNATDSELRSNFTTIIINITQPRLQWSPVAGVSAGRNQTVTVYAGVLDNSTSGAYNITISSPCRAGWACTLNSTLVPYLAGNGTAYFEFNMSVGANETAPNATIALNATDFAGRSAVRNITVTLNQPSLSWQGIANAIVSPGGDYNLNYTLANIGSADASSISLGAMCPAGWICLLNQSSIEWMGAGTNASLMLAAHVSGNDTSTTANATLTANYNGFTSTARQNFTLRQPNVSWVADNQVLGYGSTQNFTAVLSNNGQENVTLSIGAICASGWTCLANASSLGVPAGTLHNITFYVLIPQTEGAGSRNMTLTAYNAVRNYTKVITITIPSGVYWSVADQQANVSGTASFAATLFSSSPLDKNITPGLTCPIGWTCSLNETMFGLPAYSNRSLSASVAVPYRETASSKQFTISAHDGTRNATQNFTVYAIQPNITWSAGAQVFQPGNNSFLAAIANNGPIDMFVTVAPQCPANWSCSFNVSEQLSLPNGAGANVNVSVLVPESEQNMEQNVTLRAYDAYRNFTKQVQVSLRVPVFVFIGASSLQLNRSQTGVFGYSIMNNGSANSGEVNLSVSCPAAITCSLTSYSLPELLIGDSVPFSLSVGVPMNYTGVPAPLALNATNGLQTGRKNVTLSVGMPSFNMTPNASTYYIRKNSNTTARITIRNNGSYTATGVMVSNSCPGGWTCILDWSNQSLAPNQSANATLYLQPALDETGDNIISVSVSEQYGVGAARDIFTSIFIPPLLQEVLISPKQQFVSNTTPNALTAGEFTGDDLMDFVAAYQDGNITLFTNNGRNFTPSLITTMPYPVCGLASGDFNEDGRLDFIAGLTTGRIYVFFRQADGSFVQMLAATANNSACGLATGDFDNDTHLDFVVGMGDNDISLFRNVVTSFEYNNSIATVYLPYGMTSGDYNADGRQDLFAGDYGGQLNFIENRMNESNLTFNITGVYGNIGSNGLIYGLCSGDYELNQTYIDVLSGDNSGDIELMRNRNNTYTQKKLLDLNVPIKALACADFDRDGDLDIMAASTQNITLLKSVSTIHKRFEPFQSDKLKITINVSNPFYADMLNVSVIDNWNSGEVYPVYSYKNIYGQDVPIEPQLTDPDGFNSTIPRPAFNGTHAVFDKIYAALHKNEPITLVYYVKINSSAVSQFAPTVQYLRLSPRTSPTSYFLSDDVNARSSRPNVVNQLDYPYSQVVDEGDVGGTKPDFSLTYFGISDGSANTNTMTNPPDANAPGYYPLLQVEGVPADSAFSEGKNYTLTATARNTGEVAGMTWITFLVNNVSAGACNVSLPINQSATCSVYWHGPAEGSYNVSAYVDYAQGTLELDEDNNGWPLVPVNIQSYADPYLVDFFFTDSAGNPINETYENGGRVKLNITVGNNGTRNATVFLISQNVTGAMYSSPYNGEYYISDWNYGPACYYGTCRDWILGTTGSGGGRAPAKIFVPAGSNSSTMLTGGIIAAKYAYGQPYDLNVTVIIYPYYTSYPTDRNTSNNVAVTKTLRVKPTPPDGDLWHAVRNTSGAGYPYNVTYYINNYPNVQYSIPGPYTINVTGIEVGNIGGEALNTSISFNLTSFPLVLGEYNVSVSPHSTVMLPVDLDINLTGNMSQNHTVHAYLKPLPNETTNSTNYYNFTIRPLDLYVANNITLSDLRPAINQTVYIYASVCVDPTGGVYLGPYGPSAYMPTPPFNATVYGNGVPLGNVSIPSLVYGGYSCPQCCYGFQVPYVIPPDVSENFTVTVQADPFNLVEESNKANNQLSRTFYLFTGRFGVSIADSSYVSGRHQVVNLALTNGEAFTLPIYGISIELYRGADKAASLYYSGKSAASWNSPSGLFNIANRSSVSQSFLVYMPDSLDGAYEMKVRIYTAYTISTQPTNASGIYALLVPGDRGATELVAGVPLAVNGVYALFTENYRHRVDSFFVSGQNNVSQAGTMYLYVVRSASKTVTIARASEVSMGVE